MLGRVFAILFIVYYVLPVSAQMIPPGPSDTGLGGINSITGMVLVPSGQRIQRNIAIRLRTMTQGDRVVMTDENGNFAFRGLPSGDYSLVIDKEKEYEPYLQVVTVIQPRSFGAQSYNVSIRLKSKASFSAKPGILNAEYAGVPNDALELFNKAAELTKKGDRRGAIDQLQRAVKIHPQFMLAYNEMGVQYLKLGELEKADVALVAALALQPESYVARVNHGIVLFQLKRYTDAVPVWRAVVKAKEQEAVGHYFLGQTLANLGKFNEAEKELLLSISLGGAPMKEAYRLLAVIYNSSDDKPRAAAALESYIKLSPKAPDIEQLKKTLERLKS